LDRTHQREVFARIKKLELEGSKPRKGTNPGCAPWKTLELYLGAKGELEENLREQGEEYLLEGECDLRSSINRGGGYETDDQGDSSFVQENSLCKDKKRPTAGGRSGANTSKRHRVLTEGREELGGGLGGKSEGPEGR